MHSPEKARATIEAAVLGISGATPARDIAYATERYEELLVAGAHLPGLDLPIFYQKAGRLLLVCVRGERATAERLVGEIRRMLSLC
jgi:hypothetical protein